MLVTPDIKLVKTLNNKLYKFIESLESILQVSDPSFKKYFETVLDSYLNQLKFDVEDRLARIFSRPDSFQIDSLYIDQPLLKCTLDTYKLISELQKDSFLISSRQNDFNKLVSRCLTKYIDQITLKYQDCCTNQREVSFSSNLAKTKEINNILSDHSMLQQTLDAELNSLLSEKEILLISEIKLDRSLHVSEIIFDYKRIRRLCEMQISSKWLVHQLEQEPRNVITNTKHQTAASNKNFASMNANIKTVNRCLEIDELLFRIKDLQRVFLFTVRLEVRVHLIYYLDLVLREGSFCLTPDADIQPDAYALTLNLDLIKIQIITSEALSKLDSFFIFDGISQTIAFLLINNLRYVRQINSRGCQKLLKTFQALQQNTINLCTLHESRLDDALRYYRMLTLDSKQFLEECQLKVFSEQEIKLLVNLMTDESMKEEEKLVRDTRRHSLLSEIEKIYRK